MVEVVTLRGELSRAEKKIRKRSHGRVRSSVSASLQWLCPSTREEEEVIDSHNPNSLMVAELVRIYPNTPSNGIRRTVKVKCCIEFNTIQLRFHAAIFAKNEACRRLKVGLARPAAVF
jgi:hypothetical protein